MHIARIEGPAAGYALFLTYLLVMAKECIWLASIEGPVAGYTLYLLSLGTQEDEDRMDDWGRHSFW